MFKFSNIKKLFSYNWSATIKNAVPKGNNSLIQDSAFKDIMNGAIVRIIAVAFSKIGAIGIAIYTVVKAYGWLYGDEIMSYAISSVIKEGLGGWIWEIIVAAIVPIIILVYVNIMKKKNQNAWPYFIVLIISLVQTLYSLYGCIGWFAGFLISPLFAIVGLVSVLLTLLGNVHIAVGCIDYCLKSTEEYRANNPSATPAPTTNNYQPQPTYQPNVGSVQPVNNYQSQPVSQPDTNAAVMPEQNVASNVVVTPQVSVNDPQPNSFGQQAVPTSNKMCPSCQNMNASTSMFCEMCGTKL